VFLLVALLMTLAVSLIYLCRQLVIAVLFTDEFSGMAALFWPQLLGDLCKTLAYVLGYVAVAKAKTRIFMAAEVVQAGLLVGLSHLLLPRFGALGVPYAYLLTYAVYLALALACFRGYIKQQDQQP
jgi:O-antigen/teichoic acid export membrane protein